jgi:hypothetical protein
MVGFNSLPAAAVHRGWRARLAPPAATMASSSAPNKPSWPACGLMPQAAGRGDKLDSDKLDSDPN